MSEQFKDEAHLLPKPLRKVMPAGIRRFIGGAVSKSVTLYRDSASVRTTVRNAAPIVFTKALTLRFRRPTVCEVFAGRNDDFVPDNEARMGP